MFNLIKNIWSVIQYSTRQLDQTKFSQVTKHFIDRKNNFGLHSPWPVISIFDQVTILTFRS